MLSLTPAAAQEILAAAARSDAAGLALRVAARQIADGSIEYGMGFDAPRDDDEPAEFGGLKVVVGSPSRPLLEDTVLDFVEIEPGRHDFIFIPPPEPGSAGCATAAPKASSGCGNGGNGGCATGGCGSRN
jgi:iron-sulfur cluster assembly protein